MPRRAPSASGTLGAITHTLCRTIIDSAFKMVEQLVDASNRLAQNIVKVTESALGDLESNAPSSEKRSSEKPASEK